MSDEADATECISGLVLRGVKQPCDCPAFGKTCTPRTPRGATMASEDGMCASYYQYARSVPSDAAE
jgi:hydrogenase expression/formation protein HypD